jgi:hypothetical protein
MVEGNQLYFFDVLEVLVLNDILVLLKLKQSVRDHVVLSSERVTIQNGQEGGDNQNQVHYESTKENIRIQLASHVVSHEVPLLIILVVILLHLVVIDAGESYFEFLKVLCLNPLLLLLHDSLLVDLMTSHRPLLLIVRNQCSLSLLLHQDLFIVFVAVGLRILSGVQMEHRLMYFK